MERVEDKQLLYKYTRAIPADNFDTQNRKDGALPSLNCNKRQRTIYEYTPCEELLMADWVKWADDD